ncbi:MAG: hypothetical protein BWX91_02003 [Spirochaetes bacterium ADurb.Bin133]|jgi:hypothetical protein|nr:MAG: hypothetical protein BWX91_02003 [Spirochaetes bacterium ADurb.Bin133]
MRRRNLNLSPLGREYVAVFLARGSLTHMCQIIAGSGAAHMCQFQKIGGTQIFIIIKLIFLDICSIML